MTHHFEFRHDAAVILRAVHQGRWSCVLWGAAMVAASLPACTCDDSLGQLRARVLVEPETLNFGQVPLQFTKELELTVKNQGSFQLTIESYSADGPFIAPTGTSTIGTFGEVKVMVGFRPTALGQVTGTLTLTTNDPDSPTVTVPLVGEGIEAAVNVDPMFVDFGEVLWVGGIRPVSREVTVSNPGSDNFDLTEITLTDDGAGAFSLDPGMVQKTFAPGESETFTVSYVPMAFGPVSGTVLIKTSARAAPEIAVALQGTGVGPQMAICSQVQGQAELCSNAGAQPRLDFDMIPIDATLDGTVRVMNIGDRDLTLQQVILTGDFDEMIFNPDPNSVMQVVIPPAMETVFDVTYDPQDYAFDAAILSFSSNAGQGGLQSVRIEGGVSRPRIEVMPRGLTFRHSGNVDRGMSTIRLFNCGQEPLTLTQNIRIRPLMGDSSVFSLMNAPPAGTVIQPQDCMASPPAGAEFQFVFDTGTNGNYTAEIEVFSDDPVEPSVSISVAATRT